MKLQQFDGGLNVRLAPYFIPITEATVAVNMDLTSGTLCPLYKRGSDAINVLEHHVYYNAKNEWRNFDVETSTVEYQNILYSADGINRPQKDNGTDKYDLGIDTPPEALTAGAIKAAGLINSVEVSVNTATKGTALQATELHYLVFNRDHNGVFSKGVRLKVTEDEVTVLARDVTVPDEPVIADIERTVDLQVKFTDWDYDPGDLPPAPGSTRHIFRFYNGIWYRAAFGDTPEGTYLADTTWDISGGFKLDDIMLPPLSGVMQYAYTYYDSTTGTESGPSYLSNEADLGDRGGYIRVGNFIPSPDPQVDQIRLYRIGNELTNFVLVITLQNVVVNYYDQLTNDQIDGRILTTDDDGVPPDELNYITQAYATLFGAVGPRLHFSEPGNPNNWPPLNFIEVDADITGIAPVGSGIIIFSKYRADILLGTGPSTFTLRPLVGNQGCVNYKSIQLMGNSALWFSTDGLCVSSGGSVEVLTMNKLAKFPFNCVDSALHDLIYYATDNEQRTFIADFRFGTKFVVQDEQLRRLSVGADKLYGWKDGDLGELYAGEEALPFQYKSAELLEGRATQSKLYKNVYIYSEGDIIVNVYIDRRLVLTRTLSETDNHQLKIPQDEQRGFRIQFEISGTGCVHEIFYEASANE